MRPRRSQAHKLPIRFAMYPPEQQRSCRLGRSKFVDVSITLHVATDARRVGAVFPIGVKWLHVYRAALWRRHVARARLDYVQLYSHTRG